MNSRWLGICVASAAALAVHSAAAQPVNGCPAGQAIQSSDASGRNVTCVALPDVSGLQGQITAEAAARAGMDATLLGAIDDLRAGMNEASIVGTYAFSGTQTCMASSFGFNDDLTPRAAPVGSPSAAVITQFSSVSTGFRTFNADGTGTAQFFSHTISPPGFFYTNPAPGGFPSSGVTSGGSGRPGGSASASEQTGTFTWHVAGDRLFIEDSVGAVGTLTQGPSAGCSISNTNTPRAVGVLGKDRRIISITHENVQVETGTTTCPNGNVFTSQRICNRERTLRKM